MVLKNNSVVDEIVLYLLKNRIFKNVFASIIFTTVWYGFSLTVCGYNFCF